MIYFLNYIVLQQYIKVIKFIEIDSGTELAFYFSYPQFLLHLLLFSAETTCVRIADVQVIMLENALMSQFVTTVPCLGR